VRENTGLRVIQLLPKTVRDEMTLFRKAMECRYPDKIILAKPNPRTLEFTALYKNDGDKKWVECRETVPIPLGVMLPGFSPSARVVLPDVVGEQAGDGTGGGDMDAGGGGEGEC